jgi:hypothetical protein
MSLPPLSAEMQAIADQLNAMNTQLAGQTVRFKKKTEPVKLAKQLANS